MAKDYAKSDSKSAKRRSHTAEGGVPGWLWGLIGMSLGLAIAAGVYIVKQPAAPITSPPSGQAQARPTEKPQSPDIPPPQQARFKFYDMLPKYEVKPSEDAYRPRPADPATRSGGARYLIQAGSFKNPDDAERRKANLALIGVESSIREVEVNGKGTRYRVQIGPPMDYRQAENTMRRLADNNIDSFATRTES